MVVAPGAVRAAPPTAMDGQNYPPTNTTVVPLPKTTLHKSTLPCCQNDPENPPDIAVLCVSPETPHCIGR